MQGTRRRAPLWAAVGFWLAVLVCGSALIFVLPMWFPPHVPAFYSSYTVGFSNRVATLATMGLSLAVALVLFVGRRVRPIRTGVPGERMSAAWLWMGCLLVTGYTVGMGWLMARRGSSTADVDYIMIPLKEVAYDHGRLYRNAEFAYGPLLFDLPRGLQALLAKLGARPVVGYLAADLVSQLLGVAVLFYVVQRLPMRRGWKICAMGLLTLASLRPALGLNYTMLRFGAPYALLLLLAGIRPGWGRVGATVLAEALAQAMSPEMGIALGVGVVVFAGWEAWRGRRAALLLLPGALVGAGLFTLLVDRQYFYVFAHFASGMLNMVVTPAPNVLVLLFAALVMAPVAVARWCRMRGEQAAVGAAVYAMALVLLSPALGLCDELHTFFNGAGMFLLSLVAASETETALGWMWGVALFLLTVLSPAADSLAVARAEWGQVGQPSVQVAALETALDRLPIGGPKRGMVYAPAGVPNEVRDRLMAEGRWAPSYFSGLNNGMDAAADERKVEEMQAAEYVLVPEGMTPPGPDNRRRMRWLRFGYVYRDRRAPYLPLTLVRQRLAAGFEELQVFVLQGQRWELYRRRP